MDDGIVPIRIGSKFEGWLKLELAAYAEQQGATYVQVETPLADERLRLCRSDITFHFDGKRYDLELKTPNTNWRMPGVISTTRPITKNISEIITDGKKLKNCGGRGLIGFVLFPVPAHDRQWVAYLERIATGLDIPLSDHGHTSRLTVPLGSGQTADVIICCFCVPQTSLNSLEV